jgi:PAS domain-containing protein
MPERMTQVLLTALRRQRPDDEDVVEVEVTDPETALAAVDAAVLATMYGDSPVGIAVLDPTGRYLRINDLLARHNGPTPAEHVGCTL